MKTPIRVSFWLLSFAALPLEAPALDGPSPPSVVRPAPFYNALEYGGYTDIAIQQAIDAAHRAGGGTIHLPAGIYRKAGATWQPIVLKDHVRLLGPLCQRGEWWADTGKGAVLLNNDTSNTLVGQATGSVVNAASVECLSLESSAASGVHISLPHSSDNVRLTSNSFQGKASAVVLNGTTYIAEVTNNFFQGQRSHAVLIRNSSGIGGHTLIFRDNWFRATAAGASMLRFDGRTATVNVHVTNNIFDHIEGTQPMIDWATPGRTFYCVGNWFEGFGGTDQTAILWRGDSATIWGNEFSDGVNAISLISASNTVVGPNRVGSITGRALSVDRASKNVTILPTGMTPVSDAGVATYNFGSTRFRHPQSMAKVYHAAAQVVRTGTYTTLSFDADEVDTDGMHQRDGSNSRLTAPIGGKYLVGYSIRYLADQIGYRTGRIVKNGSAIVTNLMSVPAIANDSTTLSGQVILVLSARDYVELQAYQTSGSGLSVEAGPQGTWFSMLYLGE